MKDMLADLIVIPSDLGHYKSGARFGPKGFLDYGLPQVLKKSGIHARVCDIRKASKKPELFDAPRPSHGNIEHEKKIEGVGKFAARAVARSLQRGRLPIVLGGDNSFSAFTAAQTVRTLLLKGKTPGLLYIDAHLDAHTEETSHTHHAHGMPLAAILGYGRLAYQREVTLFELRDGGRFLAQSVRPTLSPQELIHVGMGNSDVEQEEVDLLNGLSVSMFSMERLRKKNGWNDLYRAIDELASRVDALIVMVDLDVFHQGEAPGVSYRSASGLTAAEWPQVMEHIAQTGKVAHVELMEYNPGRDEPDQWGKPKTAVLATKVLLKLLSKKHK